MSEREFLYWLRGFLTLPKRLEVNEIAIINSMIDGFLNNPIKPAEKIASPASERNVDLYEVDKSTQPPLTYKLKDAKYESRPFVHPYAPKKAR